MYVIFYIIICKIPKNEKESIHCKTKFLFSFNISVSSYVKINTVIGNFS